MGPSAIAKQLKIGRASVYRVLGAWRRKRGVATRFAGDVVLPLMGRDLCLEIKARAEDFRELCAWLTDRDVLIGEGRDRQELLVVHNTARRAIEKINLTSSAIMALAEQTYVGHRCQLRHGDYRGRKHWLSRTLT